MKKIFWVFIPLVAFIVVSCNSNEPAAPPTNVATDSSKFTTLQWLDTLVNFGSVNKGEKVHIKFTCKNTGTHPLYIISVHPSCGCTVADYTKKAIPSGETGEVDAEFDSEHASTAVVRKSMTVTTNTKKLSYLVFTGEVKNVAGPSDSPKPADSSKTSKK